ncbi:MAG: transporter substrate-binding domain-containing protein [Candidatus Cloacimonadota bacterium]|nr:transporter substrate-binding domain-containing protein [Candidatus Cloacimonadota bacterium]
MRLKVLILFVLVSLFFLSCSNREKIEDISQLAGKDFAVPTGTIADQLVRSKFPAAQFKYYNTVLDACLAVKSGKADASAYDEPQLRNIAAKLSGVKVLPEMISVDEYGFAVSKNNPELKNKIDALIDELKSTGKYEEMMARWLPQKGNPAPMPKLENYKAEEVLRFGTSAITEPFSYISGSQEIVGLDIEIAKLLAKRLNKKLEIINMDFGAMIPALTAGKVDFIGACITISEERKQKVLFSKPYYKGGIAALVRE